MFSTHRAVLVAIQVCELNDQKESRNMFSSLNRGCPCSLPRKSTPLVGPFWMYNLNVSFSKSEKSGWPRQHRPLYSARSQGQDFVHM